jgi:hypothetical protein
LAIRRGLAKLYDAVASTLGLKTPSADFASVAREAKDLEAKYAKEVRTVETIENPKILCAASEQYAQPDYGFDLDVAVVERYFPGRVTVDRALTSARLMDLLTTERFDIVHLVTAVDPDSGDLIFGAVDPDTRQPVPGADVMPPPGFASLLVESQTSLVVLATCKALLLAVEVATVANMAASDQDITGQEAADWENCFYRLLSQGQSIYKAFELARQQRKTSIRAVRHKDLCFSCRPGRGRVTS